MATIACEQKPDTLFRLLPPSESGIHFSNRIIESDSLNVLENEYVYNGGGVALADFNHDGLLDVYMTGNMVANALYLNKGNLSFENITEKAGVANMSRWSSGVSLVDINRDGWTDIYVAATNRPALSRRSNALFIHQGLDESGVPIFEDQAMAYGLADTSHTTHTAFFDYDNDGDLDVFLAVDAMIANKQPNKYKEKNLDGSTNRVDKLFRNDWNEETGHPVFTDVSREAGILIEGYSLGLNITDINRDGWKDIFITNDYVSNDILYINNGDGTFTDQASRYFKHTSHSAMGNDVVDLNSDGLVDIVCLDMLPEDNFRRKTMLGANNYTTYLNNKRFGYDFQYVRNTFQLNQGNVTDTSAPVFSERAMYSGISATDWSWTPLVADFDNDGYRDMIVTNGFPKDVTDRDFVDYWSDVGAYASQSFLLSMIPSVKISNYAYQNQGNLTFKDATDDWGIRRASFSSGAAYGDLDNDGDLDYIVNNIDDSAFVFQNQLYDRPGTKKNWLRVSFKGPEKNPDGTGAILELESGDLKQHWEHTVSRGYLSSIEPFAHFGLDTLKQVDKLRVIWPDGKVEVKENVAGNQVLTLDYTDAKRKENTEGLEEESTALFAEITQNLGLDFIHPESDYIDFNVQPMLPHKLTQFGPALAVSDVDGDGLEDVYIGGSHFNKGRIAIQNKDGGFDLEDLLPGPDGDLKKEEELGVLFFDADQDGDEDLYLVSGGYEFKLEDPCYQDRLFVNQGGAFYLAENALPAFLSSGSVVKAADYDKDGDLDLFVGGRVHPFQYPVPVSSYLLKNESTSSGIKFILDTSSAPALDNIGMVCDALWTDYDNNGSMDLLLAGEWMPLTVLKNTEGSFTNATAGSGLEDKMGWWNSLVAGDFDRDGDIDYIAGNQGENTLFRATDTHPVTAYGGDFDGNKGFDFVQGIFFPKNGNDKSLIEAPFVGRMDFQKQMIIVRQTYPQHQQFGQASLADILPKEKPEDYVALRANYLQSSYIENQGDGTFSIHALPREAQMAPLFGMLVEDFDGDALLDVLILGNDFGTEVSMGRSDAMNGLFLKGNGAGGFVAKTLANSGFYVPGDAKALVRLQDGEENTRIFASQNAGQLKVFGQRIAAQYVKLKPMEFSGYFHFSDGTKQVWELGYGTSFLSQSSRSVQVPEGVNRVEIHDFRGEMRVIE